MNMHPSDPQASKAAQLLALEVFSDLLASTSPDQLGQKLTEQLRELTGAGTVFLLTHPLEPVEHEALHACPPRRAAMFAETALDLFCPQRTPGRLPLLTEDFPLQHPLRDPLLRAGVRSLLRFPLYTAQGLGGAVLLLDLPEPDRTDELSETIALLLPAMAMAVRNAFSHGQMRKQAAELEILARDLERRVAERTADLEAANRALRESEKRLRGAILHSPLPIMLHAEDGEVLMLSDVWTEITGYTHADIPTTYAWTERAYGQRMHAVQENIRRIYGLTDKAGQGVFAITTKSGEQRAWDFLSAPLGALSDGRRLAISMAMDVTERNRAEEEKARLEDQLRQAQKMESVGRLAGGIAHDFNNMLAAILGHADIAMRKLDAAHPLRAHLEEIGKAARRSADLTRQLLAFARKQTVAPKVLDLNEAVAGLLAMLRRLIGENIQLDWRPEAGLWPIRIDPSQIDQILANLCVNARDAIADVGQIAIETKNIAIDKDDCDEHAEVVPGEYILLSVSDTGCGIDSQTLPHIFEPFFTTKRIGKGTGLGLATVYGIVKQNNGAINVHSEVGRGTTFRIYLPRHVGKAEQAEQPSEPRRVRGGRETILLVEDEPAVLRVTALMLQGLGYHVLSACDPREAMRLAETRAAGIDLLITDVVMPEMNGRDLATRLLAIHPQLKCVFTSGYTANVIANHGMLENGVHFVEKPFSTEALAAKVREILDSR